MGIKAPASSLWVPSPRYPLPPETGQEPRGLMHAAIWPPWRGQVCPLWTLHRAPLGAGDTPHSRQPGTWLATFPLILSFLF